MKIFTILLTLTGMLLLSESFEKTNEFYEPPLEEESLIIRDTVIGNNKVRGIQMVANLAVNTADELLLLADRAKAKGANTIFFADSKTTIFGINGTAGNRWDTEMKKFADGVKERDMDLIFMTIVMGFCGSLIADEPNLTTGYPIENQPLRATNGELVPVSTANVPNGGFENFNGNTPDNWTYQDAPGTRTFIDTAIKRSGKASFRAEAKGGAMSRVITAFDVKPFHQYTLRFWVKTENLTASNLLAIIRDDNNKDRNLTNLRLSTSRSDGGRSYFNRPNNLTLDWTEIRIAFNSLEATKVNLGLSMFGGTTGKLWWDDVAILDTPALNWLNRNDLPKSIKHGNGSSLNFGVDVALPVDTKLGLSGYAGRFDTQHAAPKILINNTTTIKEGDIVEISGYHGLPTADGQISCSWNSPESYARMRLVHQRLQDTYQPAGFLLNYSEIRTGGWEPTDTQYSTSGEALAASIKVVFDDLFEIAPEGAFFFWNDMIDPYHNARANYYQVKNTLDKSWLTLDPNKVVVATWWESQKITDLGPSSLNFFSNLGFEQITGAFYDEDVTDNFNRWQTAAQGVGGIVGNMYATWVKDYSKIEAYGDLWWGEGEEGTDPVDEIVSIVGPEEVISGETYPVNVDYLASETRDIVVSLQLNREPWTNYGYARVSVPEGSDTAAIDIVVDSEIPIAVDDYKWNAYIAPTDGNYADQLDIDIQYDVDAVAEEVIDEIVSITGPEEVNPGETYTISVDYIASEARDVVTYLQLNSAPWTIYAYEHILVSEESTTMAITLTVDSEIPIAVDDYKWVSFIAPIGGNWSDRLDILEQKNVDAIDEEMIDELVSVVGAQEVIFGNTYTVNVDYIASKTRDIIVTLQLNGAPWTNYGYARVSVPEGSDTAAIDIVVDSEIPIATDAYKWNAYIAPVGGNYSDLLDIKIQYDVDSIENFTDEILSLNTPEEVNRGKTYTVNVDYTASETREIIIYFQLNKAPWTGYAYNSVSVPVGRGTAELIVTVDSETPIAVDAYKWSAILVPTDGNWDERLDIMVQNNIDVVSNVNSANRFANASTFFVMYPNPVKDVVILESSQEILSVDIYDLLGRVQSQLKLQEDSSIDVSQLNEGAYTLTVTTTNGQKISKKLIIKH